MNFINIRVGMFGCRYFTIGAPTGAEIVFGYDESLGRRTVDIDGEILRDLPYTAVIRKVAP